MGDWWDTPYRQAGGRYGANYLNYGSSETSHEILEDYRDSVILKNMSLVFGAVAARAIINRVSRKVGKSRSEILSNFETFSKTIIQVYGEEEGRKFLDKLPETD